MEDFWNEKYQSDEYYFGTEPNEFFRTFIDSLPAGKVLLPGAGEGRNAIYAAEAGWEVDAFDTSAKGRDKALRLAKEKGVDIHYSLQSAQNFDCRKDYYDVVALIFLHLPPEERTAFHQKIVQCLKPDSGSLYLLAFSEDESNQNSSIAREGALYSAKELTHDFKALQVDLLQEEEVELQEGKGHRGKFHILKLTALRHQAKQAGDTLTL